VIYSGIDWSGDAGDPRKSGLSPLLVTAIAHIDGNQLPLLHEVLDRVRADRGLSAGFAFRYSASSDRVRAAFFSEFRNVPMSARAMIVDKRRWGPERYRSRGYERIDECIVSLVCACPPEMIAGQVLLIDQPRKETAAVTRTATAVKRGLRGIGVHPYPQIKPVPDHRAQGSIVQVADMIAGALHDAGAVEGPYLASLRGRIVLV